MINVQVTQHAKQRMLERGIKKKPALKLLRTAPLSYRLKNGHVVYRNADLKFIIEEHEKYWKLITVAKRDEWYITT